MNPRWAIFVSGRGSNLQSVLDSQNDGAEVALVVCNRPNALALLKAKKQAVPRLVLSSDFSWDALIEELKRRKISHVMLLGFMKLVPESLCQEFEGRIFNLHPSLLPDFPGLHAIEKSYQAGGTMGVTVHHVTAEMDAGEILLQKKVLEKAQSVSLETAKILISHAERRLVQKIFHLAHFRPNLTARGLGR